MLCTGGSAACCGMGYIGSGREAAQGTCSCSHCLQRKAELGLQTCNSMRILRLFFFFFGGGGGRGAGGGTMPARRN